MAIGGAGDAGNVFGFRCSSKKGYSFSLFSCGTKSASGIHRQPLPYSIALFPATPHSMVIMQRPA